MALLEKNIYRIEDTLLKNLWKEVQGLLISIIRTIILYFIIVAVIRLMGKRQLGELQPTELIITILISNIATLSLENVDLPLILGLIPILTLVIMEVIVSVVLLKFPHLERFFTGRSLIVIKNGKLDQKRLAELRISPDDIMLQLRQQGIFNISDVSLAIVETTGKLSVYEKFATRKPTTQQLGIADIPSENLPPLPLVTAGCIIEENLNAMGKDRAWLEKNLSRRHLKLSDIYILTLDTNEQLNIIKKGV